MISPIPHVMVAMRYHACLLAALHGIPFCALAYDDKVASLATELGQPVLDSRFIPPHAILPVVEDLLAHYETYQTQLITHRSRLHTRWRTTLHDLLRV